MKNEHLDLLENPQPAVIKDVANIHYSKSYDMLNHEDRKHLAYILLLFAYLGDENVFKNCIAWNLFSKMYD